jgi:hypothetical protein
MGIRERKNEMMGTGRLEWSGKGGPGNDRARTRGNVGGKVITPAQAVAPARETSTGEIDRPPAGDQEHLGVNPGSWPQAASIENTPAGDIEAACGRIVGFTSCLSHNVRPGAGSASAPSVWALHELDFE